MVVRFGHVEVRHERRLNGAQNHSIGLPESGSKISSIPDVQFDAELPSPAVTAATMSSGRVATEKVCAFSCGPGTSSVSNWLASRDMGM